MRSSCRASLLCSRLGLGHRRVRAQSLVLGFGLGRLPLFAGRRSWVRRRSRGCGCRRRCPPSTSHQEALSRPVRLSLIRRPPAAVNAMILPHAQCSVCTACTAPHACETARTHLPHHAASHPCCWGNPDSLSSLPRPVPGSRHATHVEKTFNHDSVQRAFNPWLQPGPQP